MASTTKTAKPKPKAKPAPGPNRQQRRATSRKNGAGKGTADVVVDEVLPLVPDPEATAIHNGEEPPQVPDGVLIVKIIDPETNKLKFGVQMIGNVQVTEATTIIELGLKQVRKELGLDE